MAWTLGVMFEIVRSFILWESSEGEVGGGGADSAADSVGGGLVKVILKDCER